MTRSLMVRRGWAALITATTLLLAACGGSNDDSGGNASLRILNATSDVASVDVYLGSTKTFSASAVDTVGAYTTVTAASYDVQVRAAGGTTALLASTYTLSKDKHYTGIAWGRSGSVKFVTLPEDDDTASITSDAYSRVRVYNATSDVGALDVYLTQGGEKLADITPTVSASGSGTLGGYKELLAGTYQMRVTAAGSKTDLRLDIPAVTLASRQYGTLIVTAGPGSVLVHSALLVQQGTLTALKNTKARVRLAASVEAAGSVTMNVAGSAVASNIVSPFDSSYTMVTAGSPVIGLVVNGAAGPSAATTLTPGGDYTVLANGTASATQMTVLTDDNRLPASGTYRIRIVNGVAGADPVTLVIDDGDVLPGIASGTASSYTSAAADSSSDIKVTAGSTTLLPLLTEKNLAALSVYTVWVLGGSAAPTVSLRKDR